MDVQVQKMLVLGIIGIAVGLIGVWQQKSNHDGSGWGIVAFCFLVSSCSAGGQ